MLVTSIFSFSHNVFKRLFPKGVKSELSGKGLNAQLWLNVNTTCVDCLLDDNFLDWIKLKAFADDKIIVTVG